MWQAFLWYLVSVLLAVRGVTQLGSEPWPLTAAALIGALVAVGMAAWRTPLDADGGRRTDDEGRTTKDEQHSTREAVEQR